MSLTGEHEFAHHHSFDHLSADYHEALALLGAKLRAATREGKVPERPGARVAG